MKAMREEYRVSLRLHAWAITDEGVPSLQLLTWGRGKEEPFREKDTEFSFELNTTIWVN